MRKRLLTVSGYLCLATGLAWLPPVALEMSSGRPLTELGASVAWLGPALLVIAGVFIGCGMKNDAESRMPSSIRLAITGNVLFLAFCALEISDGLVRQGGNIFYWTSFLFLPALLLLYGLLTERRAAWWSARALSAGFVVFCIGTTLMIPFGDISSEGEPIPALGRCYMIAVTLVFVASATFVFHSLGKPASRRYFSLI